MYVPEYFSATLALSKPALPGTATVKVADPLTGTVPHVCGNGVPEVVPSVAVFMVRLGMAAVPVLLTVMVNV